MWQSAQPSLAWTEEDTAPASEISEVWQTRQVLFESAMAAELAARHSSRSVARMPWCACNLRAPKRRAAAAEVQRLRVLIRRECTFRSDESSRKQGCFATAWQRRARQPAAPA